MKNDTRSSIEKNLGNLHLVEVNSNARFGMIKWWMSANGFTCPTQSTTNHMREIGLDVYLLEFGYRDYQIERFFITQWVGFGTCMNSRS